MRILSLLLVFLGAVPVWAGEPALDQAVRALLVAPDAAARKRLRDALLDRKPDPAALVRILAAGRTYAADVPRGRRDLEIEGQDGRRRPYVLYVPESYDPRRPHPLLVDLHGGVSRPVPPTHDQLARREAAFWGEHAPEQGWFLVAPSGDRDALWWTESGAGNVLSIVRSVRRTYNIDENRVLATGFSDGASGCFYLAIAHPTPFAAFAPLNGHIGVAGAGGLQVHLRNLLNRPLYVVNTRDDTLYPAAALAPLFEALQGLGASLVRRQLEGTHSPAYLAAERPRLWDWMQRQVREPHPARIFWAGTEGAPHRVHWLEVLALDPQAGDPKAFPDVNPLLPPGRVRLGISVDPQFGGPGVRVAAVQKDSAAARLGLEPGDVLSAFDGKALQDLDDLRTALGAKGHGDAFHLAWRRGDRRHDGRGTFPPAEPRPGLRRGRPWACVEARLEGNVFTLRQRGVRRFALFLPAGRVNPAQPVIVRVNGATVFKRPVTPDAAFLLDQALADEDRTMLYSARLELSAAPDPD